MNSWVTAHNVLTSLVKKGLREYVVCGGARNAVLLEVLGRLEAAGLVKVWSHFEERSASFFALGRTMLTGKPCGVVVTSGTAVAELFPAVIEAFYQARPLVMITADRHPEFAQSGAPQSIVQEGIFKTYATDCLSDWEGKAPLHINVPLDESFQPIDGEISLTDLESFSIDYGRPKVSDLARWLREPCWNGLVVMIGDLEPQEQEEVFHFCKDLGAPVVAEATSGLRESLRHLAIMDEDVVLRNQPPSKILRLGGVPSGRFWRDLENLPQVSVWSISRNGLRGLGRQAELNQGFLNRILPALGECGKIGDRAELLEGAKARREKIEEALVTYPDSEQNWVRTLSIFASMAESVYLGNSLPIREWNAYAQWERNVPLVRANRGANGIDGQISSWLGASAEEKHTWGIFGDLTALYDLAGLKMLGQIEKEGRVLVVINNGGGRIFDGIPRFDAMSEPSKSWMTAESPVDFSAIAKAFHMNYQSASRTDEFEGVTDTDQSVLLEIIPNPNHTSAFSQFLR